MSHSSCCKAGNMSQLFPFEGHVIEQLSLHCVKHQYCEWLLAEVEDDLDVPSNRLCGTQNTHIWSMENPYTTHGTALHLGKIVIWCAVSHHRVVGLIFFKIPLTQSTKLTQSMNSSYTLLKRKLPKCGSNKTVQHALQHG
jgi:hypothetical protein